MSVSVSEGVSVSVSEGVSEGVYSFHCLPLAFVMFHSLFFRSGDLSVIDLQVPRGPRPYAQP